MKDKVSLRSMGAIRFCLCVLAYIFNISITFLLEGKILKGICRFIRSFVGFDFDVWIRLSFGSILEGVFDHGSIRVRIDEGFRFQGVRCQISIGLRGVPIVYEGGSYVISVSFLREHIGDIYWVGVDLFDSFCGRGKEKDKR